MSVIVQALILLALLFIIVELITINNNLFELCRMVQAIYRKGGEE